MRGAGQLQGRLASFLICFFVYIFGVFFLCVWEHVCRCVSGCFILVSGCLGAYGATCALAVSSLKELGVHDALS